MLTRYRSDRLPTPAVCPTCGPLHPVRFVRERPGAARRTQAETIARRAALAVLVARCDRLALAAFVAGREGHLTGSSRAKFAARAKESVDNVDSERLE
jgi:hypothetical protein